MAKKNIIWLSVIFVIILAAFLWLTQSLQWRSYIDAVVQEDIPPVESQNHIADEIKELEITALIPPSETFNRIINDLSLPVPINVKVNYIENDHYTYESYKQFLLTEESGDIHLLPNEWILPLAVQGFFTPLDRVLTSEYVEEQTVALIESMRWNSNLWSAPYQLDPYVVIPHGSLSTYFEEAEQFNQAIVAKEPASDNEEAAPVEVENEVGATESSILHPPHEVTMRDVVAKILADASSTAILINSDKNSANNLFQFMNYIDQKGVHNGKMLTEKQYALLERLYERPSSITEKSIGEMFGNSENNEDKENSEYNENNENGENIEDNNEALPLFLVLSWSEFNKHQEHIANFYDVSRIELPIYWTNGYSFVIRHQTKLQEAAGQWIEALNRKMSEQHITNVGMPIHKSNLNMLNAKWQQQVSLQYNDKFNASSLMQVSTSWPIFYEQLNQYWSADEEITVKLKYWLEQAPLTEFKQ